MAKNFRDDLYTESKNYQLERLGMSVANPAKAPVEKSQVKVTGKIPVKKSQVKATGKIPAKKPQEKTTVETHVRNRREKVTGEIPVEKPQVKATGQNPVIVSRESMGIITKVRRDTRIELNVLPSTYDELKQVAKKYRISMNELINQFIEFGLHGRR